MLIVYPQRRSRLRPPGSSTTADVTAGTGATQPVAFAPTPTAGTAPLKVSFQTDLKLPAAPDSWQIVLGDGNTLQGSGAPPTSPATRTRSAGTYRVLLIVNAPTGSQFLVLANITVAAPPVANATGKPTGTVLLNGRPFTGGPIPYGSKLDVTHGRLTLTTDTGTITVYGKGVFAAFLLLRGTDNGKPIVELRLIGGNFAACNRKLSAVSANETTAESDPPALVESKRTLPHPRPLRFRDRPRDRSGSRPTAATAPSPASTKERCKSPTSPSRRNSSSTQGTSHLARKP